MIENRRLLAGVALACLIVAGCGDKQAERNKAAGEVLEGSISDAMIATDTLRAEPPIAPRQTDAPGAKSGKPKPQTADGDAPAATPTPEASPAAPASPTPSEPAAE